MKKISLLVLTAGLFLVGCGQTTISVVSSTSSTTVSSVEESSVSSSQESSSEAVSSSSESSTSSSSEAKTAPSAITLTADKTVLGLSDSAIITLSVTGGNETITPEVAYDSPVAGTLVKNVDGTYTAMRSADTTYGGNMVIIAQSEVDSTIQGKVELKFTASLSEEHASVLSKTYDQTLGGVDFAGEEVKATDTSSLSINKASDGNYYNLTLGLGDKTYNYFTVYDFNRNEVQFASEKIYTGDYKSYNNLNLKIFDNYVEVYSVSLKLSFATTEKEEEKTIAFDVSKVSFKTGGAELDETKEYAKDVGDSVMIAVNTDTTEEVTYSFEVIEGADYVTKGESVIATACKYTINANGVGQTIKIKASVTNGTLTASKTMTIKVNGTVVPTFCADLIGTWNYEDIYEYTYKLIVTSASDIKIEEYTDDDDSSLVAVTFTASNITPLSSTSVSFKITSSTGEDGELFVNDETVTISYDSKYQSVYVSSENLDDEEFTA